MQYCRLLLLTAGCLQFGSSNLTKLKVDVVAPTPEPVLSEEEGSEHEGEELAGPPSPGPSSLAMPQVSPEGEEIGQEPGISKQSDSDGYKSWLDPHQRRRDKRTQQKRRHARD